MKNKFGRRKQDVVFLPPYCKDPRERRGGTMVGRTSGGKMEVDEEEKRREGNEGERKTQKGEEPVA